MNIEKNNKPVKVKKVKLNKPELIVPDFSSIKILKGNKHLLDHSFHVIKYTYLNLI
jgi:hypothetical protein